MCLFLTAVGDKLNAWVASTEHVGTCRTYIQGVSAHFQVCSVWSGGSASLHVSVEFLLNRH